MLFVMVTNDFNSLFLENVSLMYLKLLLHRMSWVSLTMKPPHNVLWFNKASVSVSSPSDPCP